MPVAHDNDRIKQEGVRPQKAATFAANDALCILVVDDDNLVLANITAMLEDLGHTVIESPSGAKALAMLDSATNIDLVITDQAMPGMTGLQLREAIKTQRPNLPVILASGYAELPPALEGSLIRLAKPFTQEQLTQAVAAATIPPAEF